MWTDRRDAAKRARTLASLIAYLRETPLATAVAAAAECRLPVDGVRRVLRRMTLRGLTRVTAPDCWSATGALRLHINLSEAPLEPDLRQPA